MVFNYPQSRLSSAGVFAESKRYEAAPNRVADTGSTPPVSA